MAYKFTITTDRFLLFVLYILVLCINLYASSSFATNVNKINKIPKMKVRAEKLVVNDFYNEFKTFGRCKYENSKDFFATSPGIVTYVSTKQDQIIDVNEEIISINGEVVYAGLLSAESNLSAEKSAYKRDISLHQKSMLSMEMLQKSKTSFDNAALTLAKAKLEYDNMVIKAPFTGYIGTIKLTKGDMVKTGDYLFSIFENGNKIIFADLPEDLYKKIDNNTEVRFLDLAGDIKYGKIISVSEYLSNNGTIAVKIFVDKNVDLIHGGYLSLNLIYNKHKAVAISEKSLLRNDGGYFIYRISKDNILEQIDIKIGTRTGSLVEIISEDIHEGDLVVTEGLTKIAKDMYVEVID